MLDAKLLKPRLELKEGQIVKIGGKGFSTGLNDGLCVKFIITNFKDY